MPRGVYKRRSAKAHIQRKNVGPMFNYQSDGSHTEPVVAELRAENTRLHERIRKLEQKLIDYVLWLDTKDR